MDRNSTTYIFGEYKYLTNIKKVPTTLKLMTNGGLLQTNQHGKFNNYGNVWYQPKAIINILSLRNAKRKNIIIYDSDNGDIFIVINTRPGGYYIIFTLNKGGLYYNYMSNTKGVYMLSTGEENLKHHTQQQHNRAKIAI